MKVVLANPYLIAFLKYLWLFRNGYSFRKFGDEQKEKFARDSDMKVSYLEKIAIADKQVLFFKTSTLDKFCRAVNECDKTIPRSWLELENLSHLNHRILSECNALSKFPKGTKIESLTGKLKGLYGRLQNAAYYDATTLFQVIPNETFAYKNPGSNVAEMDEAFVDNNLLSKGVTKATEEDIYKIYDFATLYNSYGDCPINGFEVKYPWFKQNPNIFYVIHDESGNVCANINILPLKEDCYKLMRSGLIDERDIKPDDLFTPSDYKHVKYIYIEGFNCSNSVNTASGMLQKELLRFFPLMLSNLADTNRKDLVICAIGGTGKGDRFMKRLGFEIVTGKDVRKDELDFFEVKYSMFNEKYSGIHHLIQESRFPNEIINSKHL